MIDPTGMWTLGELTNKAGSGNAKTTFENGEEKSWYTWNQDDGITSFGSFDNDGNWVTQWEEDWSFALSSEGEMEFGFGDKYVRANDAYEAKNILATDYLGRTYIDQ